MKKVFISQPMKGKTDASILMERAVMADKAHELFGDVEIIDSVFHDEVKSKNAPVVMLARSLKLMAEADIVMFAPGWEDARGCRIEHEVALAYSVGVIVDKW